MVLLFYIKSLCIFSLLVSWNALLIVWMSLRNIFKEMVEILLDYSGNITIVVPYKILTQRRSRDTFGNVRSISWYITNASITSENELWCKTDWQHIVCMTFLQQEYSLRSTWHDQCDSSFDWKFIHSTRFQTDCRLTLDVGFTKWCSHVNIFQPQPCVITLKCVSILSS